MAQPLLLKIYGHLEPATSALLCALHPIMMECLPAESDIPVFTLKNDLLLIAFEGIYFPLEEFLAILRDNLSSTQNGKLDVINLESWTLRRFIFADGKVRSTSAPLNNVLDYSGH